LGEIEVGLIMSDGVEWLFQGRDIRVWVKRGTRDEMIATFCHWKYDRSGGFGPPGGSSWVSEAGFGLIRIETAWNDWYQNDDLLRAQEAVAERADEFGPVRLYGNSMGAVGALMFGAALNAVSGLLISPRLPPSPFRHASMFASSLGPAYTLLFDPLIPVDVWSAEVIGARVPLTECVPLSGGGHPATGTIHRAGRYAEIRRYASGEISDPQYLVWLHRKLTKRLAKGTARRRALQRPVAVPVMHETLPVLLLEPRMMIEPARPDLDGPDLRGPDLHGIDPMPLAA
jgi:hypothetical protein